MVDERLKCRQVRMSNLEDLIWICIEFESERLFVGGVYLVPPSSSRWQKADELVGEIGADVARFCLEGQVILAGDWNCKIGQLESVAQERVFVRKTVSDVVDARGRRMIELLNLSDVVVLNGVQKARAHTLAGLREAMLVERTSELEYWIENQVESDHVAIGCSIKLKNEIRFCEKEKKRKREF